MEDAHVDLNAVDDESLWDDDETGSSEESYEMENGEGALLREQIKGMIFAESPVGAIDKGLLATAKPKVRKKYTEMLQTAAVALSDVELMVEGAGEVASRDTHGETLCMDDSFDSQTTLSTPSPQPADALKESPFLSDDASDVTGARRGPMDVVDNIDKGRLRLLSKPSSSSKFSLKNDAKYRMLIAKRNSLQQEPILQFFAETRFTNDKK